MDIIIFFGDIVLYFNVGVILVSVRSYHGPGGRPLQVELSHAVHTSARTT